MTAEELAIRMAPIMKCVVCGRRLKSPESRARHVGPTCWKKTPYIRKQIVMQFEEKNATN